MKKIFLLLTVLSVLFFVKLNGQNRQNGVLPLTTDNQKLQQLSNTSSQLYNNGPLINSPGTGYGGADESLLQDVSLSMGTLGFGNPYTSQNWYADDFTITEANGWDITSFIFYTYFHAQWLIYSTECYIIIYDGKPGMTGTNVVWGDETTNVLTTSTFSNIMRNSQSLSGSKYNYIVQNTCQVSTHLNPGTYWVAYRVYANVSAGALTPPITINGQDSTGNAIFSSNNQSSWNDALDSGTNTPQGFPFIIEGSSSPSSVPISTWAIGISALLILIFIANNYKRKLA